MAVFIPVAMMQGIIGRFFFQFGITVTVAVLLSLVIAIAAFNLVSSLVMLVQDKQADIDAGRRPGTTTGDAAELKALLESVA